MDFKYIALIAISLIFISACSSSYEELSNNSFEPPSNFTKHVFNQYKLKADFEAKEMHDWNSAKLYSEKALKASKGIIIKPEKINKWNIEKEEVSELKISYDNLMLIYDEAMQKDPYNLAKAIISLDCWAEQLEEKWQTWDIEKCKNDFLNSMHNIYELFEEQAKKTNSENLSKEKSESKSVTVITKNKKEEILQIIYFDFDKSILSKTSNDKIKIFVEKNINLIDKFLVVGHADSKGTKKYNYDLSLERANEVKKSLINFGINEEKIKILAEGENMLLIQTGDEVAHPANRRAEIKALK